MSRPRDADEPRSVFITTRWTPAEVRQIDRTKRAKETRSHYLRRLVAEDSEDK